MIHPTAIIHPQARVAPGVRVGPYAVLDEHVEIGAGCELGPHVYITGHTRIGENNKIHAGAVIGDWPQDLRFQGGPTGVRLGQNNVIREHVTIHRSNDPAEPTTLGSNNLLMAQCHVGHNSQIGSHVIIANGTLLGGHAVVQDRAFISALCMIHQFARVGTLALMQGGAGISKDLPPFTIARGNNSICGLNIIGLRRAGFSSEERLELKALYHRLFRRAGKFDAALAAAENEARSDKARLLLDFLKSGKRSFCTDVSGSAGIEEP